MKKYRVAQVGLGPRGVRHVEGFLGNPDRFELVALCDLDKEKQAKYSKEFGISTTYTDAEKMLAETKPDVFCFVTQPETRLSLVELGVKHKVKALAFEKPMALNLKEAWAITDLCREHKVKAVVCQQHKYVDSFRALKKILDAGDIGRVTGIHASMRAWLFELGVHYMDYILWANSGVRGNLPVAGRWVVAHAHGRKHLAPGADTPSPDYVLAQILFENGVRAFFESGYLSPVHMAEDSFFVDDRLTVYGTHGYVWADPDGHWGAFTKSSGAETLGGTGESWGVQEGQMIQPLYLKDLADWLDDESKLHPCNLEQTYHGFEILVAMCLSGLDNTRVDLPLPDPAQSEAIIARMRKELPEVPPIK